MFANIYVVILHVDGLFRTRANTLPTEKTLGDVVPYGNRDWFRMRQNLTLEALKRDCVLNESVYRLTAVPGCFEN
jgi:hypothetical protein